MYFFDLCNKYNVSIGIYCIYFSFIYIITTNINNSLWDLAVVLNGILQGSSEGRNMQERLNDKFIFDQIMRTSLVILFNNLIIIVRLP